MMFYLFILKFAQIVHAHYKKNQYFFSSYTNFEIFQKFSVQIKIFLHVLIVPMMYVKKVLSNNDLFLNTVTRIRKQSFHSVEMGFIPFHLV